MKKTNVAKGQLNMKGEFLKEALRLDMLGLDMFRHWQTLQEDWLLEAAQEYAEQAEELARLAHTL